MSILLIFQNQEITGVLNTFLKLKIFQFRLYKKETVKNNKKMLYYFTTIISSWKSI